MVMNIIKQEQSMDCRNDGGGGGALLIHENIKYTHNTKN
jgi:hypothetical protein